MTPRSYSLLGLLSDWSTDGRHSFWWGFWLSDRSIDGHCRFGICGRLRTSMWLLGLLTKWLTDGCYSFGWGYWLSGQSIQCLCHSESVQYRDRQYDNLVCWAIDRLMEATALGEVIGWVVDQSKVTVHLESLQDLERQCGYSVCSTID